MQVQRMSRSRCLLSGYNFLLSIGAIYIGIRMLQSDRGVFIDFPNEWTQKLPFDSWFIPGILVLIIFGLGNLGAGLSVHYKKEKVFWIVTGFMGGTLLLCLCLQYIILGEWYLPNLYFLAIGLIQLFSSLFGFVKSKLT